MSSDALENDDSIEDLPLWPSRPCFGRFWKASFRNVFSSEPPRLDFGVPGAPFWSPWAHLFCHFWLHFLRHDFHTLLGSDFHRCSSILGYLFDLFSSIFQRTSRTTSSYLYNVPSWVLGIQNNALMPALFLLGSTDLADQWQN